MLDVVALAMLAVLPLLAWSIYLVKYQRRYALHKRIQLATGAVLLVTVALFEIDMRANGWRERAADSAYATSSGTLGPIEMALGVHLVFAVSAALLWILVIVQGLRKFASSPAPGAHSPWHRRFGKLAAIDMCCTAITGWLFYWLAFVA